MGLRPSVSPPKQTRTQQHKKQQLCGRERKREGKEKSEEKRTTREHIRFLYSIVTRLEMENWKPVSVVCLLIWLRTGRGQATE